MTGMSDEKLMSPLVATVGAKKNVKVADVHGNERRTTTVLREYDALDLFPMLFLQVRPRWD